MLALVPAKSFEPQTFSLSLLKNQKLTNVREELEMYYMKLQLSSWLE